jgi:hypothetical protein
MDAGACRAAGGTSLESREAQSKPKGTFLSEEWSQEKRGSAVDPVKVMP